MRRVPVCVYAKGGSNAHRFAWAEDLISQGDTTFERSYILRMVTMEAEKALSLANIAPVRDFGLSRPPHFAANPAQVRLGQALAARVAEITRLTSVAAAATGLTQQTAPGFARQMRDVHALTSRAIARFLISGRGTTEIERNFISRVGIVAALCGLSVAVLARSYNLWRDTNLQVLHEEVSRLHVGNAVSSVARKVIMSSADSGLRRMARAYEYQVHAAAPRDEKARQPAVT